jgi:hypothetical protein
MDDAKELVWRALDSGTSNPSVYLTAADILRHEGRHSESDDMRRKLALLPTATDVIIGDTADYFVRIGQIQDALDILQNGHKNHPHSQKLLIRIGDLQREMGEDRSARQYYDEAARLGLRTKEGKLADQRLITFAPTLTDKERGSTLLAAREALGIGLFFLLMGWQDAGLDLLQLGASRWGGVGVGILGGYLLVTATSSPQQQPLAAWFGGQVPASTAEGEDETELPVLPLAARLLFAVAGALLLALAFYLTFSTAIGLLNNPNPPDFYIPPFDEIFG